MKKTGSGSSQKLVSANFSLLYPKGSDPSLNGQNDFLKLSPAAAHDLRLEDLMAAFTPDRGHQKDVQELFSRLPRDPQIISYRQAVLEDMLVNPQLVERFTSLLPVIESLFQASYHSRREMSWLHEVVERVGELQNLIDCYEGIGEVLRSMEGRFHSEGLLNL